jgi:hypothetical protein
MSTVDSCCQRAKVHVHRLVTLPEQSCKMSWSCCGIFFSGVCVNFEYLEMWIHYISKCNSAHHYFSKCNSVPHYLISSKCKQLLFFISKCKPAFIFRALLFLECFYFSRAHISRALLFLERFYFSGAFISRALLFLFSKCKPALIFCSSRYETVSNCCSKTISYLLIISWIIWLCFKWYF